MAEYMYKDCITEWVDGFTACNIPNLALLCVYMGTYLWC